MNRGENKNDHIEGPPSPLVAKVIDFDKNASSPQFAALTRNFGGRENIGANTRWDLRGEGENSTSLLKVLRMIAARVGERFMHVRVCIVCMYVFMYVRM